MLTPIDPLKDDVEYTVTVTIAPKEGMTGVDENNEDLPGKKNDGGVPSSLTNTINVFKPELTFKDSEVWYGDTAPESYDGNLTQTRWVHYKTTTDDDGTTSTTEDKAAGDTGVTMLGDKPTLTLTYTPDANKVSDGKINSKADIPVDVTVKIGNWDVTDYTTFKHTDCTGRTDNLPAAKEFLLHVKTCSLTIKKKAGTDTTIGDDEYFVFNVKKDGEAYTQAVIRGTGSVIIGELPVGNYTVEEDASTAWRYTSGMSATSAPLSKDNTSATIICTNGNKNDKWLNHFNRVVNIFGKENPTPDQTFTNN